jgi:hypothetical protein
LNHPDNLVRGPIHRKGHRTACGAFEALITLLQLLTASLLDYIDKVQVDSLFSAGFTTNFHLR